MVLFSRLIAICLTAFFFLPLAVLYLAIENKPHVEKAVVIAPDHIARIKHIIDTHRHNAQPGEISSASILPEDFDIAINYLAHLFANGRAQASLNDGNALLLFSYPIPGNVLNGYLNFETTIIETDHLPLPQSIRIGNFQLPEQLTKLFAHQFLRWLQDNNPEFRAALAALQQIRISQDGLNIVYRWEDNLFGKADFDRSIGTPIISKQEQERLSRYHLMFVNNRRFKNRAYIPLSEFLATAMHLASKHSISGDPLAENRAAILVTTFHVLNLPFKLLFPEAISWPKPDGLKITLDGRNDFAKHFMVSAAITAYADTTLSDAIGLYKEIEDSRSGSGFSFNDIAANYAGIKFAEKAVAHQSSALKIQKAMTAVGLKDTDLMPAWSDLPEHMPESEFVARFGGIDSPQYQQLIEKIEQRIATLKILR